MMRFYYNIRRPIEPKEPKEFLIEEELLLSVHKRFWNITAIEEYDEEECDEGYEPWMIISGSDLKSEMLDRELTLDDIQMKLYADYAGNLIMEAQQLVETPNPNYDTEMTQYYKDMDKYRQELADWTALRDEAKKEYKKQELERLEQEKSRLEIED
jgi:hypothetical protein